MRVLSVSAEHVLSNDFLDSFFAPCCASPHLHVACIEFCIHATLLAPAYTRSRRISYQTLRQSETVVTLASRTSERGPVVYTTNVDIDAGRPRFCSLVICANV